MVSGSVGPGGRAAGRGSRLRAGYSLVEVLVALTLLAVGALGAAAATQAALAALRHAEAHHDAVTLAAVVLDSLRQSHAPLDGSRVEGRYLLSWSVSGDGAAEILLAVEFPDGAARRRLEFAALHSPPPPRFPVGRP
jgi:prepilin-type N-terminal cleavage/methylation domain-containing protein